MVCKARRSIWGLLLWSGASSVHSLPMRWRRQKADVLVISAEDVLPGLEECSKTALHALTSSAAEGLRLCYFHVKSGRLTRYS